MKLTRKTENNGILKHVHRTHRQSSYIQVSILNDTVKKGSPGHMYSAVHYYVCLPRVSRVQSLIGKPSNQHSKHVNIETCRYQNKSISKQVNINIKTYQYQHQNISISTSKYISINIENLHIDLKADQYQHQNIPVSTSKHPNVNFKACRVKRKASHQTSLFHIQKHQRTANNYAVGQRQSDTRGCCCACVSEFSK